MTHETLAGYESESFVFKSSRNPRGKPAIESSSSSDLKLPSRSRKARTRPV